MTNYDEKLNRWFHLLASVIVGILLTLLNRFFGPHLSLANKHYRCRAPLHLRKETLFAALGVVDPEKAATAGVGDDATQ